VYRFVMNLTTLGVRKLGVGTCALLATTLLGCPVDPERRDSGVFRDGGAPAALGTCALPRNFTVMPGAMLTIMGDTTDGPVGPLDLGGCGEQVAASRAPQDVLAIRVGGTGERAIRMSLRQSGTAMTFDTLLQSRGACTSAPERDRCFDNVGTDVRSEGGVMVNGGDTLFVIVTGADNDNAPYELLVESTTNAAPTLTSATFSRIADTSSEIVVSGADADSNALGIGFQLLDASGTPISVAAAGAPADVGPFFVPFAPAISTATFNNVLLVGEGSMFAPPIGAAVRARIFVNDFFASRSAPMDVTIADVSVVPAGAMCDATRRCAVPNTCTGGTCTAPAGAATLCAAATTVSLMAPVAGSARVVTANAMIPAGAGVLGGCSGASGGEVAFNVTVPAGAFDLTARTINLGTADTLNTVVYVRSTCTDATSERACGDDDFDDVRSNMQFNNATAGTYTVVVGARSPLSAATPVQVDFRLRPLRAVMEPCDPQRIDNRCDTMDGCTGSAPGEEGNVCAP
jgi:hypothetical protein